MLEVDAGADFPGQFVGGVELENVGGVQIEVVVVAVDVVVRVGEVVPGRLVGEAAAVDALLALNRETSEDLQFVGEALDGGDFDSMIRVVVQQRNVRNI